MLQFYKTEALLKRMGPISLQIGVFSAQGIKIFPEEISAINDGSSFNVQIPLEVVIK